MSITISGVDYDELAPAAARIRRLLFLWPVNRDQSEHGKQGVGGRSDSPKLGQHVATDLWQRRIGSIGSEPAGIRPMALDGRPLSTVVLSA